MIKDRRDLFASADPAVTSSVLWYMVEETEHKNVAFELYQDLFDSYWPRVWGLIFATYHEAKNSIPLLNTSDPEIPAQFSS